MFSLYFLVAMNGMTRPNTPYLALVINCAFFNGENNQNQQAGISS